ncbi:MAG: substrate-binding domain-containing protein [Terriglobales bacterium]
MLRLAFLLSPLVILGAQAQNTPPWSQGHNDPVINQGYVFHVSSIDNVPDLHGNPVGAKLVLFIGGNQFFVLPRLVASFEHLHPELKGHIFYETLPPGVLRKQMMSGNAVTLGNLTIDVAPDVFEAGAMALNDLHAQGAVTEVVQYATNDLEIMVARRNPKHIEGLKDLVRGDVRLAMPNPELEGVARQITASLKKGGGDTLAETLYGPGFDPVRIFLTQIHHRQTPMRILSGESDAGIVWSSEVRFQEKIGNPIEGVKILREQNTTGIYAAGIVKSAPHQAAATAWLEFLRSDEGQAAYREFGFKGVSGQRENQ